MTDHIDLDELATDDDTDDTRGNDGDWFWRDEGGSPETDETGDPAGTAETPATGTAETTETAPDAVERDDSGDETGDTRVPHVPRTNRDQPVGIPKESGGAGGATARDQAQDRAAEAGAGAESGGESEAEGEAEGASGPHGGGADDMTLALTYEAAKRLTHPAAAFADAARWADWIGVVGDVRAHVLTKFQRDNAIDLDFFSGAGMEPAERLADIDRHSMFYAERMVLVGVDGQEGIAERAGWEFVPLSEAAANADWELTG